jgi:hypothetical protein
MRKEHEVGDTVWIHVGGPGNPLVESKVVMVVDVPSYGRQYIVEYDAVVDWVLEIREWSNVSPDERGPINLIRLARGDFDDKTSI